MDRQYSGPNVSGDSRWISDGIEGWVGGIGDTEVATFATKTEALLWRVAPDMVTAIEELLRMHATHSKHWVHEQAKAAIAKAEGRA